MKNCSSLRKAYEANFKSDGEPAGAMAAAWQKALGISVSEDAPKAKPELSKAAMKHANRKERTELLEPKAKLKPQPKKEPEKPAGPVVESKPEMDLAVFFEELAGPVAETVRQLERLTKQNGDPGSVGDDRYKIEQEEFEKLVAEMKPLNFRTSGQLSRYIKENRLGRRYPHISGFLTMGYEGREWEFEGGISRRWYRELCVRLNLSNQCSGAEVIGFRSYHDQ